MRMVKSLIVLSSGSMHSFWFLTPSQRQARSCWARSAFLMIMDSPKQSQGRSRDVEYVLQGTAMQVFCLLLIRVAKH